MHSFNQGTNLFEMFTFCICIIYKCISYDRVCLEKNKNVLPLENASYFLSIVMFSIDIKVKETCFLKIFRNFKQKYWLMLSVMLLLLLLLNWAWS